MQSEVEAEMRLTAVVWLALTCLAGLVAVGVAYGTQNPKAYGWIASAIGVSLVVSTASWATVRAMRLEDQPLPRLGVETLTRVILPLSVLLAVMLKRPELVSREFLLYFLPFQFITLIASTIGSVRRVNS